MEQSSSSSCSIRKDEEWGFRGRITRENTNSRRFSASYLRNNSFREDHFLNKSFRANVTISSTASSPGYPLKDEIDPSTYSFTTALKALQARTVYNWECMSPDGLALNSKWYEAEKYISNPLSGEVPIECLSSKTLSARSFRNFTSRITMSAPLIYPSHQYHTRPMAATTIIPEVCGTLKIDGAEKKAEGVTMTRDVGTQSTPPEISGSSSPSPSSTPSIKEKALNRFVTELGDSPKSFTFVTSEEEQKVEEIAKETREEQGTNSKDKVDQKKKKTNCWACKNGCLSFTCTFWTRRKKYKEKRNIEKIVRVINNNPL